MNVSCPHCELSIALVEEQPREEVVCPSCGSSFKAEPGTTTLWTPAEDQRTLGRFELIDHIGMGAFGTVYKARDSDLDRVVAIKVPRAAELATKEDFDRFLREARSVAQLRHPGIVPIFEVGKSDDLPFLVSEYVDGVTLADQSTGRAFTHHEVAALIESVTRALEYAHGRGVIHRDVKPANIMLGEDGQPRLMDFGLAKRDMGEITMTVDGQVLGTPAYMSPEQASGQAHQVDGRSDIYSLGVILYWLLTGNLPFQGNSRMLIYQVQHEEPPSPRKLNPSIPRDLETICLKAMAKDPKQRYFTAHGLAEDLRRYRNGEPIHARRVSPATRLWRWCKRKPAVAGLSAALMVVVVALALLVVTVVSSYPASPLSTILNANLDAETRLEILRKFSLDEPRKTVSILRALESEQDAAFVQNALKEIARAPTASGWDPEAIEILGRVARISTTLAIIAALFDATINPNLADAMIAYVRDIVLPESEKTEAIRSLILIIGRHESRRLVHACLDRFQQEPADKIFEWLYETDWAQGIDLKNPAQYSVIVYTRKLDQQGVQEIGQIIEERMSTLLPILNAEKAAIDATFELEYVVGAIGEIQTLSNVRYSTASRLVRRLLERRHESEMNDMLDTIVSSHIHLSDDPVPLRDVLVETTHSVMARIEAARGLGDLHDQVSLDRLATVAQNSRNEVGILNLQVEAIKSVGKLAADSRRHGKSRQHIVDMLLEFLETDRDVPHDLRVASILAYGEAANSSQSIGVFEFLLHSHLNASAAEATQSIIYNHPESAGEVVDDFLSWYAKGRPTIPYPTVQPSDALVDMIFSNSFSYGAKESARKKMAYALVQAQKKENYAIRKLADKLLHKIIEAGDAPKIDPNASSTNRERDMKKWIEWWRENEAKFHLDQGGIISRS